MSDVWTKLIMSGQNKLCLNKKNVVWKKMIDVWKKLCMSGKNELCLDKINYVWTKRIKSK